MLPKSGRPVAEWLQPKRQRYSSNPPHDPPFFFQCFRQLASLLVLTCPSNEVGPSSRWCCADDGAMPIQPKPLPLVCPWSALVTWHCSIARSSTVVDFAGVFQYMQVGSNQSCAEGWSATLQKESSMLCAGSLLISSCTLLVAGTMYPGFNISRFRS